MKQLTLIILLALAPLSWGEEPFMTTPFKCIVEYEGGVSHGKNSQRSTAFKVNGEEFRLLPRSNLPASALELFNRFRKAEFSNYEDLDLEGVKGGVDEKNTYAVRDAASDPSSAGSWTPCNLTTFSDFYGQKQIVCTPRDNFPDKLFRLNLDTKKFVRVYLGSWDAPPFKDGYYGDDSVFSFGTCRPYYD